MWPFLRDLKRGLLQLVLPNTCWVCETPLPDRDEPFCQACSQALTTDPHLACPRCGSTVGPFVPLDEGCTQRDDAAYLKHTLAWHVRAAAPRIGWGDVVITTSPPGTRAYGAAGEARDREAAHG